MPTNAITFSPALPLLHIDDNANDRLLVQEAIRFTNTSFEFYGVDGVNSAVDYFALRADCSATHPRPVLILLDYDLGIECGTDFLCWLCAQRHSPPIPVIIYSGSVGHAQVKECYAKGADYFLRKAQSLGGTMAIIRALHLCFSLPRLHFQFLAHLPEAVPNTRIKRPSPVDV